MSNGQYASKSLSGLQSSFNEEFLLVLPEMIYVDNDDDDNREKWLLMNVN